jgi:hypothetical protein
MVYQRGQKTLSFNFHQVPLKVQINLICFKNATGNNVDYQKNTAECGFYIRENDF